jgi:RNA polymerase sigma factor (TIGR02999 family)
MVQPAAMDETQFADRLRAWAAGDSAAGDALYASAYDELKSVARRTLRSLGRGDQLSTTLLVNECWLKLARSGSVGPQTRQHYLALCARAMRQIVVDSARRRLADKRGGGAVVQAGEDVLPEPSPDTVLPDVAGAPRTLGPEALVALEQALATLETGDPRLARIAECRIYAGLECAEIAAVLGVTERTVQRDWVRLKALLLLAVEQAGT